MLGLGSGVAQGSRCSGTSLPPASSASSAVLWFLLSSLREFSCWRPCMSCNIRVSVILAAKLLLQSRSEASRWSQRSVEMVAAKRRDGRSEASSACVLDCAGFRHKFWSAVLAKQVRLLASMFTSYYCNAVCVFIRARNPSYKQCVSTENLCDCCPLGYSDLPQRCLVNFHPKHKHELKHEHNPDCKHEHNPDCKQLPQPYLQVPLPSTRRTAISLTFTRPNPKHAALPLSPAALRTSSI